MDQNTFLEKVRNKEIKNGTMFAVYNQDRALICTIRIINTTIVYLDMPNIPGDILMSNYIFEEVKDNSRYSPQSISYETLYLT